MVDLGDLILALKVLVGMTPGNLVSERDVNGDDKVGMEEAVYILDIISGVR